MKKDRLPLRFQWALEMINVQPDDLILEIGCGAGVLAAAIAGQLKTGHIHAIDQSAPMCARARKRNEAFITRKKVSVEHAALHEFRSGNRAFNKVIAFNVNTFQKQPARELSVIRNLLLPGGNLYIFQDAPGFVRPEMLMKIRTNLEIQSFQAELVASNQPLSCAAFIAVPLAGSS